jgi:hypothetical protein
MSRMFGLPPGAATRTVAVATNAKKSLERVLMGLESEQSNGTLETFSSVSAERWLEVDRTLHQFVQAGCAGIGRIVHACDDFAPILFNHS